MLKKHKTYYENGQLKGEGSFKNGKPEGLFKTYYDNGQLEGEGSFKNGKPEGLHKMYYDNGHLESEITYKNGKEINRKSYEDARQVDILDQELGDGSNE